MSGPCPPSLNWLLQKKNKIKKIISENGPLEMTVCTIIYIIFHIHERLEH